jgi:hypothetical protein
MQLFGPRSPFFRVLATLERGSDLPNRSRVGNWQCDAIEVRFGLSFLGA